MGMNCRNVRYLMSLYVDGDLYPEDSMAVREHLATCRDCRAIYDEYRSDLQLLTQFTRTAPYLPVADSVRDRIGYGGGRRRWGGWSALAAGGHRLAAGLAVAALLVFVLASGLVLREMGLNGGGEPASATPETARSASMAQATSQPSTTAAGFGSASTPSASPSGSVIAALEDAGLVFPIGAQGVDVEVDATPIHIFGIAADRGVTYLVYRSSENKVLPATLVDDRQVEHYAYFAGPAPSSSLRGAAPDPGLNWLCFRGLNPATKNVTIRIQSDATGSGPREVSVPVDLSRFRGADGLDISMSAGDVMSGVKIEEAVLTRGIVVSTLEMRATVVDRSAISSGNVVNGPAPEVAVNLDAKPVQIAGVGMVDTNSGDTIAIVANLYQLPSSGTLSVTVDSIPIANQFKGVAKGPWTLKSSVSSQSQQAAATTPTSGQPAQPTATAAASTPRPTPEPTRAVPPTPSPDRQSPAKLPSDLYFLAQVDGANAVWLQPADGGKAHIVAQAPGGISNYWLAPGNSIAYKPMNEDKVYLAGSDGQVRGEATMPDGRSVVAYVPSPDGQSIAYVTTDWSSLWVSGADGKNPRRIYQVPQPGQQSVHQIEWSANGKSIAFQDLRVSAASRTMVADAATGNLLWDPNDVPIDLALSRDGNRLIYATYDGLFLVELSSGAERNITPAAARSDKQQLFTNLTVLPDGTIAFTHRIDLQQDQTVMYPAKLWTMNADGSNPALVREDLGPIQDWAWAESGGGSVFAVGLVESQSGGSRTVAGLNYYRGLKEAPEPLATDAARGARAMSLLQWRAAK